MNCKLNLTNINNRICDSISSEEALKEVIPLEWADEVLAGEKKVSVNKVVKENDTNIRLSLQ